jgi:hypothetical protein
MEALKYGRSKQGATLNFSHNVATIPNMSVIIPRYMLTTSMYSQNTVSLGRAGRPNAAAVANMPHSVRLKQLTNWWRKSLRLLLAEVYLLVPLALNAAEHHTAN